MFRSLLRRERWYWQDLFFAAVMVGLSGCFAGGTPKCDKPQEYQTSGSIESLDVPDGLDQPDRTASMNIPERSPNARDREKIDPCLQSPPDYFGR